MKKGLIIIGLTAALIAGALYTVSSYNKSNSQNASKVDLPKENAQSEKNSNASDNTPSAQLNTKIKIKSKDFKLKALDGNEVSLGDLKGKKVFLNFWASWCPPCKAEMPEIEKLYQETKNSDLVILAVDIGEDKKTVESFIATNKYNFKVLMDVNQDVASKYSISSIPSSFFIDKDGNIVATHLGSMNLAQMKSYIQLLDK